MTTHDELLDDPVIAPLHKLLIEAAETERRLPRAMRRVTTTYWPDTKAEWLSYADEHTRVRLQATTEQVTRYERAIRIVPLLPADQRRLVWAVAFSAADRQRGPAWSKLGRMLGMDRRRVKRDYEAALRDLLARLLPQRGATGLTNSNTV
jgi:hypothetical protein